MLSMQQVHLSTIALGSLMEQSDQFLALANTNRIFEFTGMPLCKNKLSHKISLIYLSYLFVLVRRGEKHDAGMLIDSSLLQELERNAFSTTGQPMSIYGDPAYPLRIHVQAPFRHGVLTPMMEQYNFDMSSVRVTVEWLFGDIINDFKVLDFKKNLKIGMSSVGKMYLVCALL